ncbi:hypothetical protein ROZALSC1DRAFT_29520 [Rozella allomycis CSF55]|uniref:S-adenosyl-L-methionine-dependent methyltransferase n=1 Tax=Rozella allomycis (strain CSF55) TaxID=988480 RepID=A0A075AVE2_ROZAC|nr:hypothetical protein O9G_001841 [Rozella allomycis CSF55]RKP18830.1 hypothetical protein ROZALSC1DRAFT_29520 [Rozella allomycis CSF55]|eukprot:EPZ34228.1 hypothetical protein O9G_001841 [Rozella allomycis CSF55]
MPFLNYISGLGAGSTTNALIENKFNYDPEVVRLATEYLHFKRDNVQKILIEDAAKAITRLDNETYDLVMHDLFTGGTIPKQCFTRHFFTELKGKMKMNGILGVARCKVYDDVFDHDEQINRNFVLNIIFCSDAPIDFSKEAGRVDAQRLSSWNSMNLIQIDEKKLDEAVPLDEYNENTALELRQIAKDHWYAMMQIFPAEIWTSNFHY